jgi:hypothetical protein
MKRMGMVRLCLVAAFVLSAVAVATASAAAPEYGSCLKATAEKEGKKTIYHGGFTDSKCTLKSEAKTGKFEWRPGVVKKFQTTKGGKGLLESVGGLAVQCLTESSVGEYSGTKEVKNIVVTFEGCESAGSKCSTTGQKAGELVTKTLEGVVGFENKALKKTALDLFPAGRTGPFIEFSCLGLTVAVRGSVLVPVKSDTMSLTVPLAYKATKGLQKPEHFEGEPNDVLESSFRGGAFEQSGQTITTTATNEEKLELNAVV